MVLPSVETDPPYPFGLPGRVFPGAVCAPSRMIVRAWHFPDLVGAAGISPVRGIKQKSLGNAPSSDSDPGGLPAPNGSLACHGTMQRLQTSTIGPIRAQSGRMARLHHLGKPTSRWR
jgi:hypothetical protein